MIVHHVSVCCGGYMSVAFMCVCRVLSICQWVCVLKMLVYRIIMHCFELCLCCGFYVVLICVRDDCALKVRRDFSSMICLYVSLCCGGCVSRCRDKLCWLWLTGPLMCCVVGLNDVVCFSTVVRIAFGCVCVVRASCKEYFSMMFFCVSLRCGGCMSIVCLYTN